MKIGAILILLCSLAYAAEEKTTDIPEATREVVDRDLPNGKGHIQRRDILSRKDASPAN